MLLGNVFSVGSIPLVSGLQVEAPSLREQYYPFESQLCSLEGDLTSPPQKSLWFTGWVCSAQPLLSGCTKGALSSRLLLGDLVSVLELGLPSVPASSLGAPLDSKETEQALLVAFQSPLFQCGFLNFKHEKLIPILELSLSDSEMQLARKRYNWYLNIHTAEFFISLLLRD